MTKRTIFDVEMSKKQPLSMP